jgi:exodeoxyribonuclease VII small subunit
MPKQAAIPGELPFEDAMRELEIIVDAMESGEMPLEESLKRYQRGVELVKMAHSRLKAVEQQVRVLEDGVLKPLDLDRDA